MKTFPLLKNVTFGLLATLFVACAQTPPKTEAPTVADVTSATEKQEIPEPLKPLVWLGGCWKGTVNHRDYREHWLPLRGEMMVGASQTVIGNKTQDYQFLRMEIRDDKVYYVIVVPDEKEHRFQLSGETTDQDDTIYTFANVEDVFPQTVSYRKASAGWMYITIEGKLNGADRKVIYPARRIDCGSGEFLDK